MLNSVFGRADITCKSLRKLTYSSSPAVRCVFLRLTEPSRGWGPQVAALAADPSRPAFDTGSWQHGWVSRLHCGGLKDIPVFAAGLAWRPVCLFSDGRIFCTSEFEAGLMSTVEGENQSVLGSTLHLVGGRWRKQRSIKWILDIKFWTREFQSHKFTIFLKASFTKDVCMLSFNFIWWLL